MQTALYSKIKEMRETGGECLIGANTQNMPYLSAVATQHNSRQRRVRFLLIGLRRARHVRRAGAY